MFADNRRPDKAWIMAQLADLGVEFSPLQPGNVLYDLLKAAQAEDASSPVAPDPAPPTDPLDHDGDGRKGGSVPKPRRKVNRRDHRK